MSLLLFCASMLAGVILCMPCPCRRGAVLCPSCTGRHSCVHLVQAGTAVSILYRQAQLCPSCTGRRSAVSMSTVILSCPEDAVSPQSSLNSEFYSFSDLSSCCLLSLGAVVVWMSCVWLRTPLTLVLHPWSCESPP